MSVVCAGGAVAGSTWEEWYGRGRWREKRRARIVARWCWGGCLAAECGVGGLVVGFQVEKLTAVGQSKSNNVWF
jgi:hypothetical protein